MSRKQYFYKGQRVVKIVKTRKTSKVTNQALKPNTTQNKLKSVHSNHQNCVTKQLLKDKHLTANSCKVCTNTITEMALLDTEQ